MAKHAPPPRPPSALRSWLAARRRPRPRTVAIASAALVVAIVVALVVAPSPHVDTSDPVHPSTTSARSEGTRGPRYPTPEIPTIGASGAWQPPGESTSAASSSSSPRPSSTPASRRSTAAASSTSPSPAAAPPAADPPAPAPDPEPAVTPQPAAAAPLLELVNADRVANGCAPVALSPTLVDQSQAWSEQQAREDRYYHSAGGFGGENVAAGQRTAAEVHADWMASPGHRANVLNCSFTVMGAGAADSATDVRYWTEQFA
jgi:uncharacterized protein YkwD